MAIDINIPSQVKTYANLAAFPATGSLKTIFIAEDTNKTYRWTGSAYVEVSAAGATGITIGTTAITSGTIGRVLFEGTGNVVQESANLFWDNTNGRLGVGTISPTVALDIVGGGKYTDSVTIQGNQKRLILRETISGSTFFGIDFISSGATTIASILSNQSSGEIRNFVSSGGYFPTFYSNGSERMRIFSTGNIGINTTTDAGFKLDVNGTARVSSTLTASSGLTISAGTFNITTLTNLYARNNNFYINSFIPSGGTISGITLSPSSGSFTNAGSAGTSRGDLFVSATNIATSVGNVTLNHFVVQNDISNTGATSLIRGFYYNPTLTSMVNTTHYAFHSTSGRHRYENLPTSPTGLASGDLWNNLGVLQIV